MVWASIELSGKVGISVILASISVVWRPIRELMVRASVEVGVAVGNDPEFIIDRSSIYTYN